ncbi:flagellar basal body rod protein FlgG [Ureibacillus sp. FSL K6-8385]|uniref:Flagellar hook protein FlgE n=1 Tax=Ureibacillus terrenus TaxID=118246 RepID=A0A540V4F2_9BACL|nr:flagellar basal body rod protein FlgG [Ureibacillus terrenus]MED3660403.1 flagellar basal body rod protein FlgG [Ureibacillus terrenus]MED3762559.1 flagellar basal body rod protein FlgG [Ureibacillus terrenus]TQE91622.1 flagellar basal body rod protein FlgG [Ureibacillus terrenus]
MLRSMYSAISGLRNHQTKLDVIGNNISNVNTYGFKKSRTVFKEMVAQNIGSASGATATRGGVNPKQVGLGSTMAAIDTIHSTGALQSTSRTLDLAISGEGFFMVADSIDATKTGFTNILFTRDGNFYMDKDGYLVNAEGKYLVGVTAGSAVGDTSTDPVFPSPDDVEVITTDDLAGGSVTPATWQELISGKSYGPIRIPTDATELSIGQDGTVTFVDADGNLKWAGQIVLAKFSNAGGLQKAGNNYYKLTENSGNPYVQVGTVAGLGSIESGFLEMSNVDLSEEFTEMIVAQRGFQANARTITTSDQILEELVNLKR